MERTEENRYDGVSDEAVDAFLLDRDLGLMARDLEGMAVGQWHQFFSQSMIALLAGKTRAETYKEKMIEALGDRREDYKVVVEIERCSLEVYVKRT